MFKKILYPLLAIFITTSIFVFAYVLYLYNSTKFDSEKLIYYNPKLTTQFYDRNGKLIANLFDGEHRIYVKYKDIPGRVIESLLATEDTSFFEHFGININAIFRALIKDIKAGKKVEGASTITQQLVKTTFLTREKRISRKIKEIFIAIKLEHILSKEEILERYLNQIYLGHGYYGIRTASLGYFRKELKDLTLKEICMIIALPKAPSFYAPTKNYEYNIARANSILRRMHKLGWISNDEYQNAITERPTVYNDTRTKNLAPIVVNRAIFELKHRFKDLSYGGYKIKLSIDLNTQKIAQNAVKYGYERLKNMITKDDNKKTLNGAMITLNSKTGDILAMVGAVNPKKNHFNRATQSQRSVGSAIKPFIYQIALNIGYNPETKIPDISRTYKIKNMNLNNPYDRSDYWKPQNYEKNTLGLITLRTALVHSRNLATINLTNNLGLDNVIREMYGFGFTQIPHNLSIALGSMGISLLKLSEEYTLFSNYGEIVKPRLILEVSNEKKELDIKYNINSEYKEAPAQAYLMIDILKDVVKKGTGRNAKVKGLEIAGKTGTTDKFMDAWFCGFTPTTQTIVWFGNDDNKPLGKYMSGGRVSAPVFKKFYENYLKLHPELKRKFDIPKGIKYFNKNGKKEIFTDISKPIQNSIYVPIF